jgi:predicted NBD/HSP70 family sugar kinase
MRRTNLSVVLATIIEKGAISRAGLASETGLNKATISSLTEELLGLGWARPGGHDQGAVGRPRELLEPDPEMGVIVGAEINVDYLSVLVTDSTGAERCIAKDWVNVGALDPEHAMERLAALLEKALDSAGAEHVDVRGLGLGVPGVVDESRRLLVAANLGWRDVDVNALVDRHLGHVLGPEVPIVMENEANLGAVAEQTYGVGRRLEHFVFLSGELGVGAGVVIGGELFRGTHGAAGEVGHVTIDPSGDRCQCGKRGCWQVFVSQGAVLDRYAAAIRRDTDNVPSPTSPLDILEAAQRGEEAARAALSRLDRYLAVGVGNLVEMYDPKAVVLGGFYSTMYRGRVDELRREVASWVMDAFGRELSIELSTRGQDSCVWGGAGAVLRYLIADPRAISAGAVRA